MASVEIKCTACSFSVVDEEKFRRHVAIFHFHDYLNSFKCDHCFKKYYDLQHFLEHSNLSSTCNPIKLTEVPIEAYFNTGFESLVEQMIQRQKDNNAVGSLEQKTDQFEENNDVGQVIPKTDPLIAKEEDVELIDLVEDDDDDDQNKNIYTQENMIENHQPRSIIYHSRSRAHVIGRLSTTRKAVRTTSNKKNNNKKNGTIKNSVAANGSGSKVASLKKYWCDVVKDRQRNGRLYCRKCRIQVIVQCRGIDSGRALDHARRHLGSPSYACNHCSHRHTTLKYMKEHITKHHGIKANLIDHCKDLLENNSNRLRSVFDQCFIGGDDGRKSIASINNGIRIARQSTIKITNSDLKTNIKPNHQPIITLSPFKEYCRGLVIGHREHYCALCKKNLVFHISNAVDHVFSHLKKPMFKCHLCSMLKLTGATMRAHLIRAHRISSSASMFTVEVSPYEDEIYKLIDASFKRDVLDS